LQKIPRFLIDIQTRAIGGKAGMDLDRDIGQESSARGGGSPQKHGRTMVMDERAEDAGVCFADKGGKPGILEGVHLIGPVGDQAVEFFVPHAVADHDGGEGCTELVRQGAAPVE
jgi:hypothetical protein